MMNRKQIPIEEKKSKKENLKPPSSSSSSPPPSSSPPHSTTPAPISLLSRLILRLRLIVHEQRIQRQTVGEDIVSDRGASDIDSIKGDGLAAFRCHFHGAQGRVHLWADCDDGAVEDCSCA